MWFSQALSPFLFFFPCITRDCKRHNGKCNKQVLRTTLSFLRWLTTINPSIQRANPILTVLRFRPRFVSSVLFAFLSSFPSSNGNRVKNPCASMSNLPSSIERLLTWLNSEQGEENKVKIAVATIWYDTDTACLLFLVYVALVQFPRVLVRITHWDKDLLKVFSSFSFRKGQFDSSVMATCNQKAFFGQSHAYGSQHCFQVHDLPSSTSFLPNFSPASILSRGVFVQSHEVKSFRFCWWPIGFVSFAREVASLHGSNKCTRVNSGQNLLWHSPLLLGSLGFLYKHIAILMQSSSMTSSTKQDLKSRVLALPK